MVKKILFLITLVVFQFSFAQEDCSSAITLCGNSAINYTPSGIGNQNEYLGGCLTSGEHHSVWYEFTIATSGTLTFDLVPTGPVDYDWAIYGPNKTCANRGTPIRCNASGHLVPTGMNMTNTNTSSAGGNTSPYTMFMNVNAGETYYLYIDNWSSTVYTFNLTWGGTATFVSPFNDPALAPNPFITPGNPGSTPSSPNEIYICSNPAIFDFSTLTSGILNGNTNFNVSYYTNANDAASGTNPITTPISVNTSNIYYYSITYQDPLNPNSSANDCKEIETIKFVDKAISASISASSAILCPNESVTLTSNQPTGNLWSTGQTSQSITVNSAGTYSLTVTNGTCSDTSSFTLNDATNPNLQINGNLVVCNNSTTLTATANGTGNTFSWSNGASGASITVNSSGTYTVTVTTSQGCSFQESVTVTVDPITVNIASPGQINCINNQVTLNANNSVYPQGSTFLWTTSGVGNIVSGANTLTPIVNASGTYTLTITSPAPSNCTSQASVTVIENTTPPTITLTTSSLSICEGDSVTLNANGAQTYTWTNLTGNGSLQTVSPTTTTTYTVTGVGANGCPANNQASITINVVPAINSTLTGGEICEGDTLILDAGSGANYSYSWSTGETSQSIIVDAIGNYFVTINNGSCSETFSAIVDYIPTPVIESISFQDTTLIIIATSPNNKDLEYSIDNGFSWQDSNTFSNIKSNIGLNIAVRIKGARCETIQYYYTLQIPNVITPNSDGYNDKIDFSRILNFKDSSVEIYDRYGKQVFKATPENPVWNGVFLSRKLPTSSYWYVIKWYDENNNESVILNSWILLKNTD